MNIKSTTQLIKNMKNLENIFWDWHYSILINKSEVVWAIISKELFEYFEKNRILQKYEEELKASSNSWFYEKEDFWFEKKVVEKKIVKKKDIDFDPSDPSSIFA